MTDEAMDGGVMLDSSESIFVVDGLRVCLESAKEAKAMESKVKS